MKKRVFRIFTFIAILFTLLLWAGKSVVFGIDKTSNGSGAWSTASNWLPAGIPGPGDKVFIRTGDSININNNYSVLNLTVNSSGVISMAATKSLTISGNLVVNGKMTMDGADINFPVYGGSFTVGSQALFVWDPYTNTSMGAGLFTNGEENFAATSTLVIRKWFNYKLALGSVVSGNFGNLTLNSLSGTFLTEWDQDNEFETHIIRGTLTIDHAWITLDKSGKISNTTIGNISLLNADSYLDLHSGTHPGSFILNTGNISIVAGMLNGIYDGNGNISIHAGGNVSISYNGYFFPIYNDGVAGVGKGNASVEVSGTYTQSSGDFRGIYNITEPGAGIVQLKFGNVHLSGGIFMGHYGCHVSGGTNEVEITGDLEINFSKPADKFRAVGLSQLSGTVNNSKLIFKIGGALKTSGNNQAEFCSHVGSGEETVSVTGSASFAGCTNYFDYGVPAAAHHFTLIFSGNLDVSNGRVFLSKIGGSGTTTVDGDVNIIGGTLIMNADKGSHQLNINGNFNQSGGNYFFHSNSSVPTNDAITTIINGNFLHSGGTINFDDNSDPGSATHMLLMNGSTWSLEGNGIITHAETGSANVSGMINFSKPGVITYNRNSLTHQLQQVKQTVHSGCALDVSGGNLQVASNKNPATDFFTVASGGILQMNNYQIGSSDTSLHSGVRIESGGLIKISRKEGLYDGTDGGTIMSTGNMDFELDENSTVEYEGTQNQVVTGTGNGIAIADHHKYGNLKISFRGKPDAGFVYPATSNVFVRKNLHLESGEFRLNSHTVTIESGNKDAVTWNKGYIKSESITPSNKSVLKWMNVTEGIYIFPFGVNSREFIPISFSASAGMGGPVAASTTGRINLEKDIFPAEGKIDRIYDFDAPGFSAHANIYWSDPAVINDNAYTIERSTDGKQFVEVKDLKSLGTSNKHTRYQTKEINLISGTSYYRLKQSYIIGSPYSKIAVVRFNGISVSQSVTLDNLGVYPNPFKNSFSLTYEVLQNEEVAIQLISNSGQLVFKAFEQALKGNNRYEFTDSQKLIPGIYIVTVTGRSIKLSRKIIKQM